MNYLSDAIIRANKLKKDKPAGTETEMELSGDDKILADAVNKAKLKLNVTEADDTTTDVNPASHDKGMFGNRQCKFKQNVWKIPQKPTGDVSQPTGLLTQSDLDNYVKFRKDDRLTFKYNSGTSGNSTYDAVRSGSSDATDIKWTDALIQELIDEGALELM